MAKKNEETEQKYEYRVHDLSKPYKDYGNKEQIINDIALSGWRFVGTSVIPMGIMKDIRTDKDGNKKILGWKIWCIEHLYFEREK